MARLRIRIELNRGGVGVPLQKLASVVAESQQFFRMLGEDTHIDQQSGEWLGFDFDHESLNFTAEFVGPVTSEQVTAFYAAFDGTTSLRRATIAQFARITESIEGDELIGFGLYLSEVGAEPAEWRCLSRRDALRIAEEIRVLAGEDEFAVQSHLPAVTDSGARIFSERRESERRERGIEPSRFAGMVREVEATLTKRIDRLEGEVGEHSGFISELRSKTANSEQSIGRLVTAVEGFCEQATRRLETIPQQTQPALAAPSIDATPHRGFNWTPVATAAVGLALLGLGMLLWPSHSDGNTAQKVAASPGTLSQGPSNPAPLLPAETTPEPAKPAAASTPQVNPAAVKSAAPASPSASKDGVAHIEIEASEPSWVSIVETGGNVVMSGLIEPGSTHDVNLSKNAVLRAGNAGGLTVRFNGTPVGALGPHGAVREIEFSNGSFKLSPAK